MFYVIKMTKGAGQISLSEVLHCLEPGAIGRRSARYNPLSVVWYGEVVGGDFRSGAGVHSGLGGVFLI